LQAAIEALKRRREQESGPGFKFTAVDWGFVLPNAAGAWGEALEPLIREQLLPHWSTVGSKYRAYSAADDEKAGKVCPSEYHKHLIQPYPHQTWAPGVRWEDRLIGLRQDAFRENPHSLFIMVCTFTYREDHEQEKAQDIAKRMSEIAESTAEYANVLWLYTFNGKLAARPDVVVVDCESPEARVTRPQSRLYFHTFLFF
jgi:hypothetical protein